MGLGDRISRLVRSNLNDWQNQKTDPQTEVDATLAELQSSVNRALEARRQLEGDLEEARGRGDRLQETAKRALQQGDEPEARRILLEKRTYTQQAIALQTQLDRLAPTVERLQQQLARLEYQRSILHGSATAAQMDLTLEELKNNVAQIDAELEWLRSQL
ncbi:PspA/IM30 family protein [Oxynema sp. CENA135]|uniref:PspA/IM30 family protein n=1 Tax=Oxynema sp. CENA135 TaxID=984206 RepID=UPI001909D399|nr:PspA/IM30 family protein [Oxynema sp. CENA135]MBK4728899.1 PspA/IM30 family protein [Oxynema sp. CENA135]